MSDSQRNLKAPSADALSRASAADIQYILLRAYANRKKDPLNMYRPLPEIAAFHTTDAHIRLITGPNQSGKTLAVCIEIARIVRNRHPFIKAGSKGGRMILVGKDERHIGKIMYPKLFLPGAFDMVPDEETGFWRAVRPDPKDRSVIDPIDMDRKALWQPSPPLIPKNALTAPTAWENKRGNVPWVTTVGNWEMLWRTGMGEPIQGIEADVGLFDEEIKRDDWFSETIARLLKRNGRFIWSCTPQSGTHQLLELHEMAADPACSIKEFRSSLENSPYIPAAAKKNLYDSLSEEDRAVRYYGEYAILGRKVYPEYELHLHGISAFDPPDTWMRIAAIDPGTANSAAVFIAVPPEADELHVYDGFALQNADAHRFAQEFFKRTARFHFEAFLIDKKAGQQTPMGYTNTIAEHYFDEFRKQHISAKHCPTGFVFGTDDTEGRILSVKKLLRLNDKGESTLKFHVGKFPELDKQIKGQYYRKESAEKREIRRRKDAVDALEYACAFFDSGIYYNPPEKVGDDDAADLKVWRKYKDLQKHREDPGWIARVFSGA